MTWHSNPLAPLEDGKDGPSMLPVLVVDAVAGALVAANAAGWRAWGLDPGRPHAAAAIDRAMPALQRLASLSGPSANEMLTFWTPGGLLQLKCRVEPVGTGAGRFRVHALRGGWCGSAHASQEAEPHAPRAPSDADAGRMPALTRLAHELRTPLSAAIAYAEVLKDEHFGPLANGRYREYARNIYESARHALSVVDGMLARDPDSAGMPELAFRDLDPADVIDNCLAVARPLAERAGLDLAAHYGPQTPRVIADEVSLKQMLLNLITNAIKFARPGDRVTLGAAYGADGCLRIEVADTGPGMALPARTGACAPEEQAGRPDAGLGIGLPLTRALAEANGAALVVDSAPGRGTRVTIAFGKDRVVPV
jgi:signal transduction histidine kinase